VSDVKGPTFENVGPKNMANAQSLV
jgi:hypothetical protein